VHQSGRLEGMTGHLVCHPPRRQFPELVIHERQEFLSGGRVTLFGLMQDLREIIHAPKVHER